MHKTIAFVAHKGGVGKTTCALQTAAALAQQHGFRVLVLDLDPQGNLTRGLTREMIPAQMTASQWLLNEERPAADYVISVRQSLDLIPNRYVPEQDQELAHQAEFRADLQTRLGLLTRRYDYIIIDTPPALQFQTRSAMGSASLLVLVMTCSYYSLVGVTSLVNLVMELQQQGPHRHIPIKPVINLYDERRRLDQQIRQDIERIFEADAFTTLIRQNVRLGDASLAGQTIFEQDSYSHGAEDFNNLAREIMALFPEVLPVGSQLQEKLTLSLQPRYKTAVIPIHSSH